MKKALFILLFIFISVLAFSQELYKVKKGTVKFTSDAPMEMIKAESNKLTGLLKTSDKTFAFLISIKSFQGFNSDLQRSHFNENYMESDKYPNATFEGKIIDDVDFSKPGKYDVRAKGKLNIHGTEQERIIKCTLNITKEKIQAFSEFSILLKDHNIKIPKIVFQKIAHEIYVGVEAELYP